MRIFFEELSSSDSWKKLSEEKKAEALLSLLRSVEGGLGVPLAWKRVADVQDIAPMKAPPKTKTERITQLTPFSSLWEEAWLRAKREAWVWDRKQRASLKKCFQRSEGKLDVFQRRVEALFAKDTNWWQQNASLSLVVAKWNELGGGISSPVPFSNPSGPRSSYTCGRCGKHHVSIACPP